MSGFNYGTTTAYGGTTPKETSYALDSQFGSLGNGSGEFDFPSDDFMTQGGDVATDSNGNIYVTDGNRVQKFNSSGVYQSQFEALPAPYNSAMNIDGALYVVDLNYHLQKYLPKMSTIIGNLVCNTTYHYRAFAANVGGMGYGADKTFKTASCVEARPAAATVKLAPTLPKISK